MASIAEWIQKIKTAIYGEEVRGAIWQSLEAMNTEVEAINVDEDQIQTNKTNIAANTAAITALNSRTNYKAIQTQLNLPSSVSINAGSLGTVFSNADLRTYTVSALDKPLTSGTLKAASYLWSNAAICVATDILVQNGKLTMALRNIAPESVTITAVRLLLLYEL
jgi:hypothetical protein